MVVGAVMVVGGDGAMGAVGEAVVAVIEGAMATGMDTGIGRAAGVAGRMTNGDCQPKATGYWSKLVEFLTPKR